MTSIEEGLPVTVTTSVFTVRASSLDESESMTVMSLDSLLSIFARWDPTSPAPAITIFISNILLDYLRIGSYGTPCLRAEKTA